MKSFEVFQAWGRILTGRPPTMSIEITRECPLRCPGCYAYEDAHLGGGTNLRQLTDYKGDVLVQAVLALVRRHRPLHLSIVGGDPLVRYRELEALIPKLQEMGVYVQLVTSAFRPIPAAWAGIPRLNVVVSVDGLPPEHDERRKPATYARILKNIAGQRVIVHCTVTGQMMKRPGYLDEFLEFWSGRPELKKVWISLFTPQRGAVSPECLTSDERQQAIADLLRLRERYEKLDMGAGTIREFANPPQSPAECVFSRATRTISADLKTEVTPCQFGGDPDCGQCGCLASMGLAAVGHKKVAGGFTLGHIYEASLRVGAVVSRLRDGSPRASLRPTAPTEQPTFPIL